MPEDPPEWVLQRRRAIGTRIREARLHRNLTQERLAERVDLDRKTVNRLELGHISPLLDHLILIADALAVPLASLVRTTRTRSRGTDRRTGPAGAAAGVPGRS